jgi:glycosyltransferase involved in cell wall biosynthesis
MKRLLFLAYRFPPVGGGGVQRSLKFARYLPEFGYEPVVLTGQGTAAGRWAPHDAELGAELPAGLDVRRVGGAPQAPGAWRRRAERWLDLRSEFARWWPEAVVDASRDLPAVDAVYASMDPYETAGAAATVADALGVPWVADLRDPWALDEMLVFPTRAHRTRELRRMGRALASAAAIVMNTDEAASRLRERFPGLRGALVTAIPNGFDPEDFDGPVPHEDAGAFRIVHTGSLHTELGLRTRRMRPLRRLTGGTVADVDILTRSLVFLRAAVEQVLKAEPTLGHAVEIHLAGTLAGGDHTVAEAPFIHVHGQLPHAEAIALVRSADLLFLPMHDLPRGVRAGIVPGKTYEYLGSGRPIVAAVPDGDARDLLSRAPTATLCRPSDVDAMAQAIVSHLRTFHAYGRAPTRRPPVAARFERRRLTGELATVLDAACVSSPRSVTASASSRIRRTPTAAPSAARWPS